MSRLVVTGAAGFVGASLVARLLADGHEVIGVDDGSARGLGALDGQLGHPRLALHRLDLRRDDLAPALAGADALLHLAGRPGVRSADPPSAFWAANVAPTRRLLRAAARAKVGRLLLASSSSVYGAAPGAVTEDAPLHPRSAYGGSKVAAEAACRAAPVETVIVRYFTVYGPGQRPDMAFARFIAAGLEGGAAPLLGDGRQARDFTYVDDAVEGTVRALLHGRAGATYNLAGGRPARLDEAIALLARRLGRPVPLVRAPASAADPPRTEADLRRSHAELGYTPAVGLAEGLARQVAAARAAAAPRLACAS
jgi:nucleoside-diphosphate-sugar epimerase